MSPDMPRRKFGLIAATLLLLCPALAGAGTLPEPTGPVILTVSGGIGNTNAPGVARFDLDMLRSLGTREISTSTIWTQGTQDFVGVPMEAVLAAVDAKGATIAARAVNDYEVLIPVEAWDQNGPILAFERNGKLMSVREKGPLWVVYPYDSSVDLQTEVIYSRSIWQLDRIEIQP
ncbi:oxidoreductase [Neotabrizicola sp. VNH66]|uniref:oxidoreductase n=1 Tax=Neotabrizicola sp. VNH66 TaxID=3400918 RepID=UPI003C005C55